ncbi:hypothetical protein SLEP1_g31967 [Rubroshorea leprosula]|uniref:BRCA1-A complex subunit Abraxas n=1 Tax=Rubroshorea leprosula TaxID=152421 RepID=A0AAV5KBV4_9ROSI|nr:hypothetical protein SLEP1_g31967 [Rubroshorea leprosula]
MNDLALQKIAVSGPTLASMIERINSSPGDTDGLLFGDVASITPTTLSDDPSQTHSDSLLVATISGFLCFNSPLSFYDSAGRVDPTRITTHLNQKTLIGWFSSRRKTPLRPSMREFSVTYSLYSIPNLSLPIQNPNFSFNFRPSIFLLFTTPLQDQLIHTNQYRAYQFLSPKQCFNPVSIDIVNIGPAFRGHYGSFSPNSALPFLSCELRNSTAMNEDRADSYLSGMKQAAKDQAELDMCAEGMEIGKLSQLMGPQAANYTAGLEQLYEKMLAKIESLSRLVEASSAKVLEQENQNRKLRLKVARPTGAE